MSQKTAPMPVANAVPLTMTMERVLGSLDVVSVQQTPRGCIQECLGCSAKSEYRLYGGMRQDFHTAIFPGKRFEGSDPEQIGHMLEESPFCPDRCFWGGMRKFKMPITVPDQNGETMMMLEKQFSFPTHCIIHLDDDIVIPCCCNLPTLKVFTPDGTYVGKTKYACDMCLWVDKFQTYNENGDVQYLIRPDTCCLGCCPVCNCGGGKGGSCLYLPYYIRDPTSKEKVKGGPGANGEYAQVRKVWTGLKKECCTSADNFFVIFPEGASTALKGALLGSTILIDSAVYEEKDGGCILVQW